MSICKIKEMIPCERPYEKCERFGPTALTDSELLAILLRSGTVGESVLALGHQLLNTADNDNGLLNLHHWSFEKLKQLRGVGPVKATQILCLSELTKRMARSTAQVSLDFSTPSSIAQYYMEDMRHQQRETVKLLMLNTKARLIAESDISKGTINASLLSPRELFIEALQKNAVAIILLHNHPSGDPSPSQDDLLVTQRIYEAGLLIGIDLVDHIIIGDNCFHSMREKGFFHEQPLRT